MRWWIFARKQKLEDFRLELSREQLIRRSRILIIDDEKPTLMSDMQASNFSVDYLQDVTRGNINKIDQVLYDMILLDFGGVGKDFGEDEGLSLLKHIKRVNPSTIVFAYTSKSLTSKQSDFFRNTDGVLPKDAGIADSLEKIEDGLKRAYDINNLWKGLLNLRKVDINSAKDFELQDLLIEALNNKQKMSEFKSGLLGKGDLTEKVVTALVEKIIELLALSVFAGA